MSVIKAVVLNASMETTCERIQTTELSHALTQTLEQEGVDIEVIRLADYDISFGFTDDDDEWENVLTRIESADIVIIGTSLWNGEKSSLATLAIERLYGSNWATDDRHATFYNKVGGVVVTSDESGAKDAAASVLYSLSQIGFAIPPNAGAYWLHAPEQNEEGVLDEETDYIRSPINKLVANTLYLAKMLKSQPMPIEMSMN